MDHVQQHISGRRAYFPWLLGFICLCAVMFGCAGSRTPLLETRERAPLPEPLTNAAVTAFPVQETTGLAVFFGMGPGSAASDLSRHAWMFNPRINSWEQLPDIPVSPGRIAAGAATAGGVLYLFGGFSFDETGREITHGEMLSFTPKTRRYERLNPLPLPVDDAVAGVWKDRYIYVVCGWSTDRPVVDVQVYDTQERRWFAATPFPGSPVFGHAGGIAGDRIIVVDGVTVKGSGSLRWFAVVDDVYVGEIDPDEPSRIVWSRKNPHPGRSRYRMASAVSGGGMIFMGGTDNPYSIDGMGYNGVRSTPAEGVLRYDVSAEMWEEPGRIPEPLMDQRGMVCADETCFWAGGLDGKGRVRAETREIKLPEKRAPSNGP